MGKKKIPEDKRFIFVPWSQSIYCRWVTLILKLIAFYSILETSGKQIFIHFIHKNFNWLLDGQISQAKEISSMSQSTEPK